MTQTLLLSRPLDRSSNVSLVEQIARCIADSIEQRILRPGGRLPSIRQCAEQYGVSRSTVVEAYDRLVAQGLVESRLGSGFYVRKAAVVVKSPVVSPAPQTLDVAWLVRSLFQVHPPHKMPGSGLLPSEWHAPELIAGGLRAVSRQAEAVLQYGIPQGYLPLRQQLQRKLADLEIDASPEQIVTTVGVTQGLGLVARTFLQPGDTVFVDDPAWFLMFGSFATIGAKVVGIPRLADGPDLVRLAELAAIHRPKLFVINSILHNPTSSRLSAFKAVQVLKIAEQFDFTIVEDDVYCDLHPNNAAGMRIATLDQLRRTIYIGGFSKTLAGSLRVGFIACAPELATRFADEKMLRTLTSSEIGERVVHKVLSEGHYRKQMDHLRGKLDGSRARALRHLERIGLGMENPPSEGMFLWVNTGRDTTVLTQRGLAEGYLFAPGSLFSPRQERSTYTRLNVACLGEPGAYRVLERFISEG